VRVVPFDAPPHSVAGISREVIDQALVKHGLRAGPSASLIAKLTDQDGAT